MCARTQILEIPAVTYAIYVQTLIAQYETPVLTQQFEITVHSPQGAILQEEAVTTPLPPEAIVLVL
tara:strand:- start:459 stop:656 length:198 start_codon:yes stop_codon:yes gene_type:complete